MKGMIRAIAILCLLALLPVTVFADDSYSMKQDGFSTSYSYIYDYWGDVQEAPNPYRVSTVIDSMTIGLDKLDGKRMSRPQSLFVHEKDLYVADTFNNRILQLRYDGVEFDLIRVIKDNPKIARHIHLPLQSGSTRVLKEMNRHYTKEGYLELVDKIRSEIKDISITTDIIVGFPGETEEDFQDTLDVVRKAKFESAFTFIYSQRSGTKAALMPDQIPRDIVNDRFNRLLALVTEGATKQTMRYTGQSVEVLVEEINQKDPSLLTGRMSNNSLVHFKGSNDLIGTMAKVHLDEAKGFYYLGTLIRSM